MASAEGWRARYEGTLSSFLPFRESETIQRETSCLDKLKKVVKTFPHLAVLGCASHDFPELITLIVCIRLTLFGVLVNSLQGVTPSFEISVMQFSKTTFIKLFVTLGYAFVGYSHRFQRRTCHTICKFVHEEMHMNRKSPAIFMVCQIEQLLK